MQHSLESETSRSILDTTKRIHGNGSCKSENDYDQHCAAQNSSRNIDRWLQQRNQFRAEQKVEHGATRKNKRVRNEPEFVPSTCFNLLASFFAGGSLKLFANFRLF